MNEQVITGINPHNAGSVHSGHRLRMVDSTYGEIAEFLYDEAALLDREDVNSWLNVLTSDIAYLMPVRVTVHRRDGDGFIGQMSHFDEDYASIELRIRRVRDSTTAWAEDPPSRTRRYVTNIRAWCTDRDTEFEVASYIFFTRSRWDSPDLEFVTAERRDILRCTNAGWRLAKRTILVDQSSLGTINMALFL